jgi:hypothetical protein
MNTDEEPPRHREQGTSAEKLKDKRPRLPDCSHSGGDGRR